VTKLKTEARIARKLEKLGDDAENWNYHEEAELFRSLAAKVADGSFSRGCQVGSGAEIAYLDGEAIIDHIVKTVQF
jgi:hypothetical protein